MRKLSVSPRVIWALVGLGLSVVLSAYVAHAWHFHRYVNDDAYISFRYSRFLAMGRGPYFNIGERVEGYSNLLLMLLITPVIKIWGESMAPPAAKIIGVTAGALSVLATFILCLLLDNGDRGRRPIAAIAGLLAAGVLAVSPSFALNSVSGLETTLFAVCLTAGVLLSTVAAQQGRWRGAGLVFACGALARPEGAVLFAAYWIADAAGAIAGQTWRARRSQFLLDGVLVTAVVLGQLVFRNLAYDGEWLPNTFYAKAGGFWAIDAWSYIASGVITPLGGLIAVGVGALGCVLRRHSSAVLAPVAAIALMGAALPFVTGTDWMLGQRLLMPVLPLAAVLMGLGWCRIAERILARPAWLGPSCALVLVPVLWLGQSGSRAAMFDEMSMRALGYERGHTALADWLRTHADIGDTIALMDTGIVGYRCIDQRILDITGLTDRFIGKSPGSFLDKQYDVGYILDRKPRFIVVVLEQPGNPDDVPTSTRFIAWTPMEDNILRSSEFQRWYRRPRSMAAVGESWVDRTAAQFGAVQAFQHRHPGLHYILTVFERRDLPNS